MKLIIGLGNIGKKYENNRHNLGFKVIDLIADYYDVNLDKNKFDGLFYKNDDFILAKPHTFMNLSGDFVYSISKFFNIIPSDILIIYDDIDMEIGKLRFRESGTSGGHNGIKDIMLKIKTENIPRLKIGIGRPPNYTFNYVLSDFSQEEWKIIKNKQLEIIDLVKKWIRGVEKKV